MSHPKIHTEAVKSSQIAEMGHDGASTMAVKFHSGSVYHYPDVTPEQFQKFKGAESLGAHFGQHHKKGPFVRIPD